ncbi:putative Ribose operon repressor [Vibrio nigripulchritudo SOn1]|uniref:Ribose operon repressor n=1 Tax=Vibrio nigripulchritudo SOn1 TaxID=1238450 RepID=A0AAV2VP48_9VIBR|nr:LacI family DNA-binding transcriptional regulator [Vibrio nigripulchritudo]CCO46152.1 putative Ribose operon repressor [Vibrio nigripulchritudo SOn1]
MATLKDVAKHAGVSVTTVSYFLNNKKPLKEETKERIQAAMSELNYQYNLGAAQLKRGQRDLKTIGVVSISNNNPFFLELFLAIQKEAKERKLALLSSFVDGTESSLDSHVEIMRPQIDALIVISKNTFVSQEFCDSSLGIPIVCIAFDVGTIQSSCGGTKLDIQNEMGGYIVGKYLISKGHKNVTCVTGEASTDATTGRIRGFKKAYADLLGQDEMKQVTSDFSYQGGVDAMFEIYSQPTLPSAVFCFNDMMGLGVLNTAHELGIKIPQDLSIIGYDNIYQSELSYPKLTTVDIPLNTFAAQALDGIQRKFDEKDALCEIKIMPRLVIRGSVSDLA